MGSNGKLVATFLVGGMLTTGGLAGAAWTSVFIRGGGDGGALVRCPGGMTRLGHEFNEKISVFPADPAIHISDEYTIADDFFLVEDIDTGAHAGTHLDAPAHFIEGGRTIDDLQAEEFVWPVYKIDVRGRTFKNNFVEIADIRRYERKFGRIMPDSLVVLQTGAEKFFGAEQVIADADDNAANVDDLFDFENPGFSAEAVQWMFDRRRIDGVGSDAYGPDAATDADFGATFTTLDNDGIALVAIANLSTVAQRGDIIIATTIALSDGSGFTTDPIACHGRRSGQRRVEF